MKNLFDAEYKANKVCIVFVSVRNFWFLLCDSLLPDVSWPFPPGLIISPQTDIAYLAAREQFGTGKAKRQENSRNAPYIFPLKGEVLRHVG